VHARLPIGPLILCVVALSIAAPAHADDQVLQYVQIAHINVPTMPKLPSKPGSNMAEAIQQSIESEIRSQVHDFLTGVIRSALSRASPIVGMLADVVASKLEKAVTDSAMPQVHLVDKPVTSTTTISSQRTRVDYAQTSIIAQCDLGKLITLNREKKTHYVTPLATGSALVSRPPCRGIRPQFTCKSNALWTKGHRR